MTSRTNEIEGVVLLTMTDARIIRVEITRITGRAWLVHIARTTLWSEVHLYSTVPAVVRDLLAAEFDPAEPAELDLVITPDQCAGCGEPVYLDNPETADRCGERWLTAAGRPICSVRRSRVE
jgi:hypothetical protein